MPALNDADLLAAWEQGCALARPARLLPLLATICDATPADLAKLPLGERDRQLLALRRRLFGERFVGLATCERCAEDIELVFDAADLPAHDVNVASRVRVDGFDVRMPTTVDLVAAAAARDAVGARAVLAARCLGNEYGAGTEDNVAAALRAADAFLEVTLATTCTRCEAAVAFTFDIEAFLWSEFEAWARRALRTIATLARAFGWSEHDILNMTPWRREAYLRIVVA